MKKKTVSVLLAAAMIVGTFAGCGSTPAPAQEAAPAEEADASKADEAPAQLESAEKAEDAQA